MSDALDARLVGPAAAVWAGAFVATGSPPGRSAGWVVVGSIALVAAVVAGRSWLRRGPSAAAAVLVLLCIVAGCTVGALPPGRRPGRAAWRTWRPIVPRCARPGWCARTRSATRAPCAGRSAVPTWWWRWSGWTGWRPAAGPCARGRRRWSWPATSAGSDLLPGQRVGLTGRLGPARAGQPVAAVVSVRGPPTLIGGPPLVQQAAGDLRAGLRRAARVLPPAERGLLPGLVLGDTSRMPAGLVDDFRTAGLTHLTAVSGANLAIVVTFVLVVGRWAGLRGRWLPATAALAMAWFVVLARPQPSVLRAAVMGAIALLALGTGRLRQESRGAGRGGALPAADRPVARAVVRLRALGPGDRRPGAAGARLGAGLDGPRAAPTGGRGARSPGRRAARVRAGRGPAQWPGQPGGRRREPPRRPGGRPRDGSRSARDRHRAAERRRGCRAGSGGRRTGRLARAGRHPVRCGARGRGRLARVGGRRGAPGRRSSSSRSLPHGC